jgi:GGDEF domain-containing protein
VLFSTPDSNYASSYSTPRKPSEERGSLDHAMSMAVQGIGGLCDAPHHDNKSFLVYPEKNIKGQVTHIYLLGSERLKKAGEKDSDKLIRRLKSRYFSFEKYLSAIYLENQSIITGDLITDAVLFMETVSQWFHLSKAELKMKLDNRINLDLKKIPDGYEYFITQPSDVFVKKKHNKNFHRTFVLKKKEELFLSEKKELVKNKIIYPLVGREDEPWGKVKFETVFPEQYKYYRFSETDIAMKRFVKQFGRNTADTLSILNQQDHIRRMAEKNKVSYQEARKSQLTNLDNATAFNEILLQIFMSENTFEENQFLTITHLDGKALGLQNEAIGHEDADKIIKKYAESIRSKFESSFHLSGDEFAIVDTTTEQPTDYQKKILEIFDLLSKNSIELEVTYLELARILVNTLIHAHKASRNDDNMVTYTPEQLWNKVGIVSDTSDPVILETKKNLESIFKRLSNMTFSPENVLKAEENLVYFTAAQIRLGINEEQIINTFVRPEHYKILEENKKSGSRLNDFVDTAQETFLQDIAHKKVQIKIKMSMTAGTYFIGAQKYKEIKKQFEREDRGEIDLNKIYLNLRMKTVKKADEIRGQARKKMKDHGFVIDP